MFSASALTPCLTGYDLFVPGRCPACLLIERHLAGLPGMKVLKRRASVRVFQSKSQPIANVPRHFEYVEDMRGRRYLPTAPWPQR